MRTQFIAYPIRQRGGFGLGNLFKGVVSSLSPIFKKSLTSLGKRALKTGVNVMQDYGNGVNFKSAVKKRSRQSLESMVNDALTYPAKQLKLNDGTTKRVSRGVATKTIGRGTRRKKPKVKRANKDIFS